MARKRKKVTRKQRKQQRREAMARKRKARGWEPQREPSAPRLDDAFEDMLPLFPELGDPAATSISTAEQLMITLMDSEYMADEPEFEDIFVDPMLCLDTFADIVQELDIEPELLTDLPDEERDDSRMRIREELVRRTLTDELRQDIVNGLNDFRLRLKQSGGDQVEVAKAAILQSFLSEGGTDSEAWSMIGLVHAIFLRSLSVGFELIEASMELAETAETAESDESDAPLAERLDQSSVLQKADELLNKIPGLVGFLDRQAYRTWEEGLNALFEGKLYLGLFSPEELETAFEIFETAYAPGLPEEIAAQDDLPPEVEEALTDFTQQLDDYIAELITPERHDQLRVRLDEAVKNPAYEKWLSFLHLIVECVADDDSVELEKRFLAQALLGEMEVESA